MCFTDTLFTQLVLPSSQKGLGVYSAPLFVLTAFLASAVRAFELLDQHFGEVFEDKKFNCGLKEWYAVTRTLEDNEHQKNWSKVMYEKVLTNLMPKLGEYGVKRLNAYQKKLGSL